MVPGFWTSSWMETEAATIPYDPLEAIQISFSNNRDEDRK
jgi:hypothetical protein